MDYKKCGSCGCFKSIEELGCRKSGLVYKCCKRCRNKEIKKTDEPDVKKEPELKEDGIVKIKDIEYDIKTKILDKEMARKLIPDFDKKYVNLEDMPDENVVIPDECFKYVLGAKMNTEMMEKLGIRITTADEEDNNIYPDDNSNIIVKKQNPVWKPDSSSESD